MLGNHRDTVALLNVLNKRRGSDKIWIKGEIGLEGSLGKRVIDNSVKVFVVTSFHGCLDSASSCSVYICIRCLAAAIRVSAEKNDFISDIGPKQCKGSLAPCADLRLEPQLVVLRVNWFQVRV